MTGPLIALAAKGAQDTVLSYNPSCTAWKYQHCRHTNFAIETIEQQFTGQIAFGRTLTATLQRAGDLASRAYLVLDVEKVSDTRTNRQQAEDGVLANHVANPISDLGDNVRHVNSIGYMAIEELRCKIGGHEFDKMTGEDMLMMEDLERPARKRLGELVGDFDNDADAIAHSAIQTNAVPGALDFVRYMVPIPLWWSRGERRDQALPLIALQYHEVRLDFRMRRAADLVRFTYNQDAAGFRNVAPGSADAAANIQSLADGDWNGGTLLDARLLIDYVFLDTRERKAFASKSLEYLIEQTQSQEFNVNGNYATTTLQLNFNHPMKYLTYFQHHPAHQDENLWDNWAGYQAIPAAAVAPQINPGTRDVHSHSTSTLQFNSQSLFQPRTAQWIHKEPMDFGAQKPDRFMYTIPFALHMGRGDGLHKIGVDPAGSVNFSRIDNVSLVLTGDGLGAGNSNTSTNVNNTSTGASAAYATTTLRIYVMGRSYNQAVAASGMFGLYFAN